MNPTTELERRLDYPLGDTLPEPGKTIEIAPGVRWLRMKLPFVLNHINLWLLRDRIDGREGWTAVDTGLNTEDIKAMWERIFAEEMERLPILRVVVTHMHPDHVGLANWLCDRFEARLWMSGTDYNSTRVAMSRDGGFYGDMSANFFAANGLSDPVALDAIRHGFNDYPKMVAGLPGQFHRLLDGMHLQVGGRSWRCVSGYGHAPEHIALYREDGEQPVLIGGDMMLPRISTNVSVYALEPEGNPLQLFLASIEKFLDLSDRTLTLPAHGKPFVGLHERVRQLKEHHADRLAEVMQACTSRPCSGADILPVMFKRVLDMHQTRFALGEALAHAHLLWYQGRLKRTRGTDGVFRFAP